MAASETATKALKERGVNTSVVRLSQVHDTHKQGAVTYAVQVAREKGKSAYVGDGSNRWSAVHISDVTRLEALGRGLKVPVVSIRPEEAEAHFGWLAMFMGQDLSASSATTRRKLNWKPTGPGLIADLDRMDYAQA